MREVVGVPQIRLDRVGEQVIKVNRDITIVDVLIQVIIIIITIIIIGQSIQCIGFGKVFGCLTTLLLGVP